MKKPDWETIKREYCAGQLSIQAVANQFGVAKSTLMDMARKQGWERTKKPTKKSQQIPSKSSVQNKNSRTDGREHARSEKQSETTSKEDDTELSINPDEYGLTAREASFVHWFVISGSRVEAYRKSGFEGVGNTAYVGASRLYRKDKIRRAIRDLESRKTKRYQADLDEVIDQLVAIIKADPNEVAQFRRVNCRYCWGENHQYLWRDIDEFDKAAAKATDDGKAAPEYGGLGFIANIDPNPECPRCNGEGEGEVFIPDTRDHQGPERQFFAGVKETKFGIEILTEDKKAARAMLVQILTAKAEKAGNQPFIIHNSLTPPGGQ
ncbi:TPA: terminase small subunit [Yersinia enterocolitica]